MDSVSSRAPEQSRRHRKLFSSPAWFQRLEASIGERVPLRPNTLSALKLFVVAPAMLLSLRQANTLPGGALFIVLLFVAFALLDYLDGVVARQRGMDTAFGRIFDRVTDYPLLFGLSYFCIEVVDPALLGVKLGLDVLLSVLYLLGRGSTQNRLRTLFSYTTLFSLLALSQGWLPNVFSSGLVTYLLVANIVLSTVVALYNLDILKKRYIADALSLANLSCGLLAMYAASHGNFVASIILLLAGATFDGVDGAAARRWGSTRWGVYSDDIADAVNFGVSPGVAVYFAVGGVTGIVVGGLFASFTVLRLVYFTLNKTNADPQYFSGVPSPVGGVIALSSIVLFPNQPLVIGMLVGMACVMMVSFSAQYRHLGRVFAQRPRLLIGAPLLVAALVLLGVGLSALVPIAIILMLCLGYALLPVLRAFLKLNAEPS